MKINDRNQKINNFVKNNLNNIEQIIDKANKLKKYILDSYNNYLSNYLPVINLYKLYLFKSIHYYSNDMNDMINNFNFDNLYQYVDDLYNSNKAELVAVYGRCILRPPVATGAFASDHPALPVDRVNQLLFVRSLRCNVSSPV